MPNLMQDNLYSVTFCKLNGNADGSFDVSHVQAYRGRIFFLSARDEEPFPK